MRLTTIIPKKVTFIKKKKSIYFKFIVKKNFEEKIKIASMDGKKKV